MKNTADDAKDLIGKPASELPRVAYLLEEEHRNILAKYGAWLEALALERIEPSNPMQNRFMATVRGIELPMTPYEKAWNAYVVACATLALAPPEAPKQLRVPPGRVQVPICERCGFVKPCGCEEAARE
jgi:hypothetical protein